jgi:hypothetical protein
MSDFPDIGSEFATAPSSAISASGDFDFDRAASAFPDISLDGESTIVPSTYSTLSAPSNDSGSVEFSFDDFDNPPKVTDVKVTGDDEIEKFEDQFPELDVPGPQQTMSPSSKPTFGAPPPFAPFPQPSSYTSTPIFNQPLEEEEPQVIKDWRAAQATEIAARDEHSKATRNETIARAERSIDEFYDEYAKKKERSIRENKDAEAEYLAGLSSTLTQGTTWERIASLVELENSQSKTIARTGTGTTDLTRFKEVLLRLKREGSSAPGAAGY